LKEDAAGRKGVHNRRGLWASSKTVLGEMARVALTEPFMTAIEQQAIYLRRLPKSLNGLRVVHLSDLHYGPLVDPAIWSEPSKSPTISTRI
jgi:predicted MPP superfamily phosphohydrolase